MRRGMWALHLDLFPLSAFCWIAGLLHLSETSYVAGRWVPAPPRPAAIKNYPTLTDSTATATPPR